MKRHSFTDRLISAIQRRIFMKKRMIAVLLACTMLISTGCSATVAMDENGKITVDGVAIEDLAGNFGVNLGERAETQETDEEEKDNEKEHNTEGGSPWIDSDLKKNIKEDMELSLKDDFHLFVNHDWLLRAEIKEGEESENSFYEVREKTEEKALALLKDDTLSDHDAKLVQSLYNAILDWDARDKEGLDPIKGVIEDIKGINNLDELTDFMCDKDRSRFVPVFVNCGNYTSYDDAGQYITAVDTDSFILEDAAEYSDRTEFGDRAYKANLDLAKAILLRLDYSESEVEEMYEDVIGLESKIAERSMTSADWMSPDRTEKINNVYEPDALFELTGAYPLKKFIEGCKYDDAKQYLVPEPEALKRIDELYTEDNLESIKDYMLIKYVLGTADILDSDAYDASVKADNIKNGSTGRVADEKFAFDTVRSLLRVPMNRLYVEQYDPSEKKKQITKICKDVIKIYREMLSEEDWLSDETREKAVEKLDSITINAVYPDKWEDYSELNIDDLSLYDSYVRISEFLEELDRSHTNGRVDHEIWDVDILEPNAYYGQNDNSINIVLGFLDEPLYYDGISEEALLGGVGSAIGHEISHAFDTAGAQYDKDGNYADWWTEDDHNAFKKRADKLIEYYNCISAWEGAKVQGNNVQTEAIADLAGMKAILRIAKEKEDFDYDKFFTGYATLWRRLNTYEAEYYRLMQDSHPLHYLRTNVTLQQFDEFIDTYDIREGDNMYLAPEDRILVW